MGMRIGGNPGGRRVAQGRHSSLEDFAIAITNLSSFGHAEQGLITGPLIVVYLSSEIGSLITGIYSPTMRS